MLGGIDMPSSVVCPYIFLSTHLSFISQYSFEHLLHVQIQKVLSGGGGGGVTLIFFY